jgi:hypothetical protein
MQPTLPPGCEIVIVPPGPWSDRGAAAPLGSLLVFASGSALVAHRLVMRRGRYLITQGDGRREPDRWLLPQQVLGRVVAAYDGERKLWPRPTEGAARLWWVGRALALAASRRWRRLFAPGRRN